MLYVSSKTQSIFSSDLAGCVHMEAGVPRTIPQAMMSDAFAKGVQPYILEGKVVEEVPVETVPESIQPAFDAAMAAQADALDSDENVVEEDPELEPTVEAVLHSAIEDVLARNRRSDFTPGGRPKLGALREITGLTDLTTDQVDEAWASYSEA